MDRKLAPGSRDTVAPTPDRPRPDRTDARTAALLLAGAVIIVGGATTIGLALGLLVRMFRVASGL